jgi:hypothetical protein
VEDHPAAAEHRALVEHRIKHAVRVHEPLLLVSQLQRSGGTLLSQLLDSHPEVHAHPQELHTGHPKQRFWPDLPLGGDARHWFEILREAPAEKHFREGYRKYSKNEQGAEHKRTLPFILPPVLQQAIFERCIGERPVTGSRDIFDAYMTSYFNAWLDNHNLYTGPKRWITGFAPRIVLEHRSVEGFFETYPDGMLVSIVRDPRSWYGSARRHAELGTPSKKRAYGAVESGVALWCQTAEAMLAAKAARPDRVYLISFEDLLGDTERTMRSLALAAGIEFRPSLLEPTFNGMPIVSNTGFEVTGEGVRTEPLVRYRETLTTEQQAFIEDQTAELHEQLRTQIGGVPVGRG